MSPAQALCRQKEAARSASPGVAKGAGQMPGAPAARAPGPRGMVPRTRALLKGELLRSSDEACGLHFTFLRSQPRAFSARRWAPGRRAALLVVHGVDAAAHVQA